ncbi:MAG: ABC transporter permease [Ferruginibacter sp.]|nr:ABC transporter permease [Ferruginibacter sp.]
MLKNYFKVAWRNLLKNKVTSLINIGGLSVGLAVAILIMLWATDEYSYDKYHANLSSIHLLMQNERQGGEVSTFQSVPGPLAASLRSDIPEIRLAARVSYAGQHLVNSGDKSLYENGIFAEPDYFKIMSFPALSGNPVTALADPNAVVITETTAKKLFGSEDAIGKILRHNNLRNLKVGAVIKDVPPNSSFKFNMVLPFVIYEHDNAGSLAKWDNNSLLTWVTLGPTTKLEAVNKKLSKLLQENRSDAQPELFAYPLERLAMHGRFRNGVPDGGRIEMILMLTILGLFILVIACINFMNLSTARSEGRAREVGVRKTMGASKKSLVLQFLSEAFLLTFVALVFSVVLAKLLVPGFNSLTERNISFDFADLNVWLGLLSAGIITALLAGSYPAFFLSRFKPVKVLKGAIKAQRGGSMLRRGLVTFQFVISIFLIIVTIVVYKQVDFAQQRPIGYNPENLIDIPARGDMTGKFNILKTELQKLPGVQSVSAASDNLVGFGSTINGFDWKGKTADQDFPFFVTYVQEEWTKTTGLSLLQGRDFSNAFVSDSSACIINLAAAQKMGLTPGDAIGTTLADHKIIGVVDNFLFNDPFSSPAPLIAFHSTADMNHFFIRLKPTEKWQDQMAGIEQAVKETNPNYPFEFQLTKETFARKFTGIKSGGEFASVVGVLAIIISCLGLFALSAFVAERRTKEIGIRKILGASAARVWLSLSTDFLKPVLLAIILTIPVARFAMNKMLLSMEYHIELSWWMFSIAGAMAIVIALLTVSFQGIKAAVANPVKSLRTE